MLCAYVCIIPVYCWISFQIHANVWDSKTICNLDLGELLVLFQLLPKYLGQTEVSVTVEQGKIQQTRSNCEVAQNIRALPKHDDKNWAAIWKHITSHYILYILPVNSLQDEVRMTNVRSIGLHLSWSRREWLGWFSQTLSALNKYFQRLQSSLVGFPWVIFIFMLQRPCLTNTKFINIPQKYSTSSISMWSLECRWNFHAISWPDS